MTPIGTPQQNKKKEDVDYKAALEKANVKISESVKKQQIEVDNLEFEYEKQREKLYKNRRISIQNLKMFDYWKTALYNCGAFADHLQFYKDEELLKCLYDLNIVMVSNDGKGNMVFEIAMCFKENDIIKNQKLTFVISTEKDNFSPKEDVIFTKPPKKAEEEGVKTSRKRKASEAEEDEEPGFPSESIFFRMSLDVAMSILNYVWKEPEMYQNAIDWDNLTILHEDDDDDDEYTGGSIDEEEEDDSDGLGTSDSCDEEESEDSDTEEEEEEEGEAEEDEE